MTLIASPESPQLEIVSLTDGNRSCGGNLALSSNSFPPLASSLFCYETEYNKIKCVRREVKEGWVGHRIHLIVQSFNHLVSKFAFA